MVSDARLRIWQHAGPVAETFVDQLLGLQQVRLVGVVYLSFKP